MKKAFYILAQISDRDFEWLLTVGKSKWISAGTTLIHEGEPIDALYIILGGTLSVLIKSLGDKEIARLGEGEVVGEMSFVDARRPSATVTATEESVVWSIPRSQLTAKLAQDLSFSSHFYQSLAVFLSDRLRSTVDRLGSGTDPHLEDDGIRDSDVNPALSGNLDLARARLNWMLNRLKGTP